MSSVFGTSQKARLMAGSAAVALSLTCTLFGAASVQAQEVQTVDEIVVTGVRASQEASIDIKRRSSEIVDAIVAEDVGKLPDVTIADALQRVTGVQISRDAGEGSFVSIRGAPQVLATLNGERFVTAENILSSNVSFEDIPASLITGVNVYKSQNAAITDGGLGGVLDLQSLRALNLDEGLTANVAVQGGWGSIIDGVDSKIDGLVGRNWGDLAMSLAGSYSDSTSASSFQQADFDLLDEYSTWICSGGCGDLNGDGDRADSYLIPMGWNSYVNSREFERERLGLAYNFNARLGGGFEVVADILYNEMTESQHGQQLFANGNFGGRSAPPAYTAANGRPSIVGFDKATGTDRNHYVTDLYGLTGGLRAGVQSVFRDTSAVNTNLEVRYDNGGAFKGSVRWVHSDAERSQSALTVERNRRTPGPSRAPQPTRWPVARRTSIPARSRKPSAIRSG